MASPRTWLLFATERYAWPILGPLAEAIGERGDRALWWCLHGARDLPVPETQRLRHAGDAAAARPYAVLSAANWAPYFVSGCMTQVFHGFNVEKRPDQRGHFRLRGMFDLYCTQGPATTARFEDLARIDGSFVAIETGWPKLDPLFRVPAAERPAAATGRQIVMFGSTFTERLSAAPLLLPVIRELVSSGRYYWLLTLHPKCPAGLFDAYRGLAGPNAEFIEPEDLVRAEAQADVLVADTSSIVSEFTAQRKPVVTLRNRMPRPHMIDIQDPAELATALERALHPEAAYVAEIERYAEQIHPYRDGRSSHRVLEAVDRIHPSLAGLRARRPYNLWRKLQVRRQLGYWGPTRV